MTLEKDPPEFCKLQLFQTCDVTLPPESHQNPSSSWRASSIQRTQLHNIKYESEIPRVACRHLYKPNVQISTHFPTQYAPMLLLTNPIKLCFHWCCNYYNMWYFGKASDFTKFLAHKITHFLFIKNSRVGAGEMVQQLRAHTVLAEDLSCIVNSQVG